MASEPELYTCPECDQDNIGVTLAGKLRSHKVPASFDETRPKCPGSGEAVTQLPPEGPCSSPEDSGGTPPEPANSATCSRTSDTGDRPPETPRHTTGTPMTTTERVSPDVPSSVLARRTVETIPGVDEYADGMERADERRSTLAAEQLRRYAEHAPKFDRPAPVEVEQPPLFDRPAQTHKPGKGVVPMTPLGLEICARLKEMFHAYSNRMDRNQQQTLGPSEIGTPCDRRIALSLMRYPPVNPGGDNWASFVGTCGHSGLEDMFLWADAGSGRYAPEVKLLFPSPHVPTGTTDLIDRILLCVLDHKFMGDWSLGKLRTEGPSQTYRVQAHTYAYGAAMRGEKVKHVAIVGWPRTKGNLDDLYVWTEEYNPGVARNAIKRVDDIAKAIGPMAPDGEWSAARGEDFPIDNSDCTYCPFYMKNAAQSKGGVCNGRH